MRLLVIEDEPALAGLLRGVLGRAGFAVDAAEGVAGAEDCLRLADYDAVILDLGLADGDGLALLRMLRGRGQALPVLILTARDAPEDRVVGLDSGADDYVVKPFHSEELVSRMRALLRRPNAALGVDLTLGNVTLHTTTRQLQVGVAPVTLSVRETSLLEMLLRRSGQVVPRDTIEEGLYGFDNPATPNAVEVLVHRLRRRLQDAGATIIVHTIRGVGYLLAES
ncbi:MAG TPA: response regulator transcription factor [Acetobacteraceae bacterium]|nr:response regulator transcription factor [Acetobacteraceae bacterium]